MTPVGVTSGPLLRGNPRPRHLTTPRSCAAPVANQARSPLASICNSCRARQDSERRTTRRATVNVTDAGPAGITAGELIARQDLRSIRLREDDLQRWLTSEGLATLDDPHGRLTATDHGRELAAGFRT